jgi:hypothetical protein
MSQADIEIWVDNVTDTIDDRDRLSPADQIAALNELIGYINNVSLPEATLAYRAVKASAARAKGTKP